jgi:hypothetical protein
MNAKTIILVVWPASVLLAGFLGFGGGMKVGITVGEANFYNERVRTFQLVVWSATEDQDPRTHELLGAAADLAGTMIDRKQYAEASKGFAGKVRSSAHQPTPPTPAPSVPRL